MRYLLTSFVLLVLLGGPWFMSNYPSQAMAITSAVERSGNELAAVILYHNPVTIAGLKSSYDAAGAPEGPKVRILIVPGHEPNYGGAKFGDLKERDLNVELAQDLMGFLLQNGRYEVFTTRDKSSWTPIFASYFKNDWDAIVAWEQAHKQEFADMVRLGEMKQVAPVAFHNDAPDTVALRLYGIDKWVGDSGVSVVIHVHFNDFPRPDQSSPGKYSGFAIYVPEGQYYNSSTTKAVANAIAGRLSEYNPVSDLPTEQSGVVEDQDLIAVGSFDSVDAASMLIEYAYLYEPQILNPAVRPVFLKELAYETYLGLQDFFGSSTTTNLGGLVYDTLVLPHTWNKPITGKNDLQSDVFALQTALIKDGDYPPAGKSMNDCPRTGRVGACTTAAIATFQEKYDISSDQRGVAGQGTIDELNHLYSVRAM